MARRELWDQVDDDLYTILSVPRTATRDDIQLAWKSTAKRTHPDAGGTVEEFQGAEVAYQVLSNTAERARYDRVTGFSGTSSVRSRESFGRSDMAFSWPQTPSAGMGRSSGGEPNASNYRNPGPARKLRGSTVFFAALVAVVVIAAVMLFLSSGSFATVFVVAVAALLIAALLKRSDRNDSD